MSAAPRIESPAPGAAPRDGRVRARRTRWRAVATLAWRDTRTARRRLVLFVSAISLGIGVLVALDSFAANVTRSIREQSRALLGGDLALNDSRPFPAPVDSLLDSLRRSGAGVGSVTTFASMALALGTRATRLVQVRAVSPGVPYYGSIETEPAGRWAALERGRYALVDPSLLIALGVRAGDTLALGFAHFAILGTLANVPGDVSIASALGPRVYIADRWLDETRLLSFGSRAQYQALLRLPAAVSPARFVAAHRSLFDSTRVRARTVQETERSLTNSIQQLDRFLALVGLVALLLGGIGVASAIHAYVQEKIDSVAVLRCLGATSGQMVGVYLLEAAGLGVIGGAIGVGLGVAMQFGLPHVIGGFLPVDVTPTLVPGALAFGLAVGVWVAVLFALLPLLAVRRVSPLQALRRDAEGLPRRGFWRDPPRLVVAAAIAGSVVAIALARAGTARQGLAMSAGVAAVVIVLWLAALLVSAAARRALRERWPFVVRQGVANLYRPANQTRAVMLSLGAGAFLIATLYQVQTSLLRQVTLSGEATRANLAFFDVQDDQVPGLDSLVRGAGLPVLQRVPIVPMRIATIDGAPTDSLARRGRAAWALRREYRSSYRDSLIGSEKLVAGRWPAPAERDAAPYPVSVEQDVANELGLRLGDTVVWDVQGVQVPTRVASLREVNWARFEPNFFVVFPPAALRGAPQTWVLLTRSPDATERAVLQREAVERFPNVSSIDLSLIQQTVGRLLDRVATAIRFLALVALATGVLVLVSAVAASRRQRLREGVLLKTLGATRAQIRRIMVAEYAVLGVMGSLTGILLSVAGAWALVHFVFEAPFVSSIGPLLAIALGMMFLTVAIGLWSGRDVFAETPMAALREA